MSVAPRIKPRVAGVLPQETRLRIANERKARCILTRALGSLCRSGSFARVKMMQAADLWDLDHLAKRGRLDRSADRRIDDSLRLDKEQCRAPIVPQSRKPDPQDTVSATERQPTPTARTLPDQKLMPECKNLCLQNSASSETISKREEYGQHGLGRLPVATL